MSYLHDSFAAALAEQRQRDRLLEAQRERVVKQARHGRRVTAVEDTVDAPAGPRRWFNWLIRTAT
jgi:hypothetical protein